MSTILLDNQNLILWGGTAFIAALVFIETGFLIGLIVPGGETLLFAAGLMCGAQTIETPVIVLVLILIAAAFIGDITGYWIGNKLGDRLHRKSDGFLFKKSYLKRSEHFYHKHKKRALILGRFLPVIRTFNPLISGSGKLDFKHFAAYSAIGCILYVSSLVLAGYFLGNAFPGLEKYVKYVFMGVAAAVIITLLVKWLKERKREKEAAL